ncbi:PDZ domain-containing protein [bacterium]|nr:PDZ domain-containing protein [bacterium]
MRAGALDLIWLLRFAGGSLLCLLSLSNCAWMPGASLASGERLNGAATLQAFAKPKGALQAHTGVVQGGTKGQLSLAMPADRSGYWLTKASAIKESGVLQLVLPGKKARPVRLVGSDNVNDVALLQVNGTDGQFLPMWHEPSPEGAWVASLRDSRDLRVGVISGSTRPIDVPQTMLGIIMEPDDPQRGALIDEVIEGGMAAEAKLRKGDRILAINARPVRSYRTLQRIVRDLRPGDRVQLEFERAGKLRLKDVSLGDETTNAGEHRNLRMSGPVSPRRAGFEQVFQHDCPLGPESMGGPVVDLQGRVVGMNIARRDRVTTFALTREALLRALWRIRSQ